MTRKRVVALLMLSLSTTAARGSSQCDQASTVAASHLRLARSSRNGMGHSAKDENCRAFMKQFVEAVTTRQAAATCRDGVGGQRALEMLDEEIQTFNDWVAEQSCVQ